MNRTDIRVSAMLPSLPVEQQDPLTRLQLAHTRLDRIKGGGEREAANAFVALTDYVPFVVSAWMVRLLTRLPQCSIVTPATNVPGPRQRLQVLGHPVEQLLPVPPISMHRHQHAQLRRRTGVRHHRRLRRRPRRRRARQRHRTRGRAPGHPRPLAEAGGHQAKPPRRQPDRGQAPTPRPDSSSASDPSVIGINASTSGTTSRPAA